MALRNQRAINFKATGCSDTFDGTNVAAGAMAALSNLIPAPQTQDAWVPRPASVLETSFSGFTTPEDGEALFCSGTRVYGFIQSAAFSGHSQPFIYDLVANAFVTISGENSGNTPTSTSNTGDWTAPTVDQVGGYVIFTHPGFNLTGNFFGWLDMSGYSSTTVTGNTHSSKTIDTLNSDVLTDGWRPGMTITDSAGDIPANTVIETIAANGLSITISNAATGSNTGTTFTVAGGTYAAPLWAAGNLAVTPLVNVPAAVKQNQGSACFAVSTSTSAAVVFSDAGSPLVCTNTPTSQIVTFENAITVTALGVTPLYTLSGGVVGSLMAFQGPTAIQQITGAPSLQNVGISVLQDSIGTNSPNSIAASPKGLYFIAPDGLRRISLVGNVEKVIGRRGMGVSIPFLFAQNATRICGAFNEGVYRVSVQNGAVTGTPTQEWWYHEDDDKWTGPHTFPAALIDATQEPHSFVMFAAGIPAKLWLSDAYASLAATYIENGVQMTFSWEPSLLPDAGQMNMNAIVETGMALAIPPGNTAQFTAVNEIAAVLGAAQIAGSGVAGSIWGTSLWGAAFWGAGTTYYQQQLVLWSAPLVFKQMQIIVSGNCQGGVELGNLYMRYQQLDYNILVPT